MPVFLPSATKLRRLCFYTCLSVHRGEYLGRYPPWDQVHPPGPGTDPPGTRYTPRDQVHSLGPDTTPPQETATVADGTHPTGMHSRVVSFFRVLQVLTARLENA